MRCMLNKKAVKVSSEQEDGTVYNSTAMVVHGVTNRPTQGDAKRSRIHRISKQAKTCCSCTRSLACKIKLCEIQASRHSLSEMQLLLSLRQPTGMDHKAEGTEGNGGAEKGNCKHHEDDG